MEHDKPKLATILRTVDLGSGVAETDQLLEAARVDTSVANDLFNDRVDLIPGTKGSGKSALYRIVVEFLRDVLYRQKKVVLAHGVQPHGDSIFQVFNNQFGRLSEDDFVNFWCIYFVSLAHEHFIREPKFSTLFDGCQSEIDAFRRSCAAAKIPEIKARMSLRGVIEWVLHAIPRPKKLSYTASTGDKYEVDLFGEPLEEKTKGSGHEGTSDLPRFVHQVKDDLETILNRVDVYLWFMVDRLDEIFPRRSDMETKALRGLLRTLRIFESPRIRLKLFLRDDIFEQITSAAQGFAALTHVTARMADKLSWSEDQILTVVVKRLFACDGLREYLRIDRDRLAASRAYQEEAFYRVFPPTVHSGPNQSKTLRWIYNHTMDGCGVVTPRDVIFLLTRARQRQQDEYDGDPAGTTDWGIGANAIQYGLAELSHRKKKNLLKAEFPHFWPHIEKLVKGKSEYSERALRDLLGKGADRIIGDLLGIGVLSEISGHGAPYYRIPFLYREGLEVTQGRVD
jgi:hypothetical protein